MLSLKNVNAIAHFTDWIPAHVHIGTLGWNGFMIFGMLYWMVPRLYGTQLYSTALANRHFWIGTTGILFWALPMYFAGFMQGLMWKEFTEEGTLRYGIFLDTVLYAVPFYYIRALGGAIYLVGVFMMAYNLWKTAAQGKLVANEKDEYPARLQVPVHDGKYAWHRILERRPITFFVLSTIAILIGGIIELVPTFLIQSNIPTIAGVKPYTPLELEGRDIYIREGCNACHTQMVRPFLSETERYGPYAKAGEFVYDHPHLWGSKRTGPDLLRVGKKYPDSWHYNHMLDPQTTSLGSIMPPYPWLFDRKLDTGLLEAKINAMITLGVPYDKDYAKEAAKDLKKQALEITTRLKEGGIEADPETEIIALIAYLQRLGTDAKKSTLTTETPKQ
jgi:cytochrome c oxidase cbb3-type subunit I/II